MPCGIAQGCAAFSTSELHPGLAWRGRQRNQTSTPARVVVPDVYLLQTRVLLESVSGFGGRSRTVAGSLKRRVIESPWKCWRLLTLETRMESCRRNSRRPGGP